MNAIGQSMIRHALVVLLVGFVGCAAKKDTRKAEYYGLVEKWEAAYGGSDATAAYQATLALIDFTKKMEQDDEPLVDIPLAMIWNYARLGLLAEHLGKKEEAARCFTIAVRYAKKKYPNESNAMTSETGLRWALEQMDTPEKIAWRRK